MIKDLEEIKNDPVRLNNSDYTKDQIDKIIKAYKKDKVIDQGETTGGVDINAGKWKGDVDDISNEEYYKSIPGLNIRNATRGVFSDLVPRRGSGAYESINEYLKQLDLGRVKSGFNSQSEHSKGLWENAIKKNKAYGYYDGPNVVYGSMKSMLPYTVPTAIGVGAAASQNKEYKKGGNIEDTMLLDLTPKEIKNYIDNGYIIEDID
jgi:hypothetical protein